MYSLDNNVPAIVDISTQGQYLGGNWLYSMPGHYVVVSGLRVDDLGRTYVSVQDPYLIGPISVDLSTFYQMLTEHWDRAIIY